MSSRRYQSAQRNLGYASKADQARFAAYVSRKPVAAAPQASSAGGGSYYTSPTGGQNYPNARGPAAYGGTHAVRTGPAAVNSVMRNILSFGGGGRPTTRPSTVRPPNGGGANRPKPITSSFGVKLAPTFRNWVTGNTDTTGSVYRRTGSHSNYNK